MSTIDSENGVYTRGHELAIFCQKTGCFEEAKCQMDLLKNDFTLSEGHRPGICRFQLDRGCDRAEINVKLGLGWFGVKRLIRKLKISFKQNLQITQDFRVNQKKSHTLKICGIKTTESYAQLPARPSPCLKLRPETAHCVSV